jgi:replicative DNA helicase
MTAEPVDHNLDAERALLAGIILFGEAFIVARCVVAWWDFYRRAHQHIFEAFRDLHDRRLPIDLVTVKDTLAKLGHLEECGGPAYLAALLDGVPRVNHVLAYAVIVRDHSLRRQSQTTDGGTPESIQ